jgi:hypothetical protein
MPLEVTNQRVNFNTETVSLLSRRLKKEVGHPKTAHPQSNTEIR